MLMNSLIAIKLQSAIQYWVFAILVLKMKRDASLFKSVLTLVEYLKEFSNVTLELDNVTSVTMGILAVYHISNAATNVMPTKNVHSLRKSVFLVILLEILIAL